MSEEQKEEKKYPEFDPFEPIAEETLDECWERYAQRIKELKAKGVELNYPLDKNSNVFIDLGAFYKGIIQMISPEKFMELSFPKAYIRACSLDYLVDAFASGNPQLDPLELWVDPNTCQVFEHNGRHRAEIAYDLDIKEIPVVITFHPFKTIGDTEEGYKSLYEFYDMRVSRKNVKVSIFDDAMELLAQHWKVPDNCTIENLIPEKMRTVRSETVEEKLAWIKKIQELRKKKRQQHGLE